MKRSVVVVAAHPDDETFEAGGAILQAIASGDAVRVVVLTAGEAFRGNLSREERLSLGRERLAEVRRATQTLGLPADRLHLLGLPDRSLSVLAALAEEPGSPGYLSPITGLDAVPYAEAYRPGLALSGDVVVSCLKEILASAGATDVYAHHPLDDHPDHRGAYGLVAQTLRRLAGAPIGKDPVRLHLFLGYQDSLPGGWPPDGELFRPDQCILRLGNAPAEEISLTPAQRRLKKEALAKFSGTHQRIMGASKFAWYVERFAKGNEVFWVQ